MLSKPLLKPEPETSTQLPGAPLVGDILVTDNGGDELVTVKTAAE